MEFILIAALSGWLGWKLNTPDAPQPCIPSPLIVEHCTMPLSNFAPANDSFGETSISLIALAGQYRKCRAAVEQ